MDDVGATVASGEKVVLHAEARAWVTRFEAVACALVAALGPRAVRVDHIGSTAVHGLPAKDVVDVQVSVRQLDVDALIDDLAAARFALSEGAWNRRDHIPAWWEGDPRAWDKLVFEPPPELGDANVHVRVSGSPNERCALLFRDFLTDNASARLAWARFKIAVADAAADLGTYGAVKDPATDGVVLTHLAALSILISAIQFCPGRRERR